MMNNSYLQPYDHAKNSTSSIILTGDREEEEEENKYSGNFNDLIEEEEKKEAQANQGSEGLGLSPDRKS